MIHCLRGELSVDADDARHRLGSGEAIVLDPNVPHAVEAIAESEMLLTVCIGRASKGSAANDEMTGDP